MKKFVYIAPVFIDEKKPDGVGKKVKNHFKVFSKAFDSYLMYYGQNGIEVVHGTEHNVIAYNGRHRRFALYEEAGKLVENKHIEKAYIRYPKSENNFIKLLKAMHKENCKIVIEIPTYPYDGNMTENVRIFAIAVMDKLWRGQIKKYVDRIVTYSDDDTIFGIKTIRTINGIDFEKVKRVTHTNHTAGIELISVATNYSCHGFDRIIGGMEDYYKSGGKQEFSFKIVGDGPAVEEYRKQIEKCKHINNRIELCGFQTGEQLEKLYNNADIAVNSLAIYRLNLKKESTLKTKEYVAKGLPMISSTEVDALDHIGNQEYVMRVADCGDIIGMEKIEKFYHKIYDNQDKDVIAEKIRRAGEHICDMEVTLAPVIAYLQESE